MGNSNVLQPSNISFLTQYLGGYAQLDEAVVGVGNGLERGLQWCQEKCGCFATTKQHELSYTWEATRISMRPLLGLAIALKRSAMMGNISAVLKPSNISLLRQYLGGYALDKSLVGVGNSLEEVGNDVLQPSNISFLI